MTIYRIETTIIPQTIGSEELADEYEQRLRNQGAFYARNEDAETIDIMANYQFDLKEDEEERV